LSAADHIFRTFFQAGFECSTHRNKTGKRLDLLRSTGHDRFASSDCERVRQFGMETIRTAARWYLIEATPGAYDFQSLACTLSAANCCDLEVLLDILHFGWPNHIDVFSPDFPEQFSRYTLALCRYLRRHHPSCRTFAPVNEVSFLSWAGGEKGLISPFAVNRGDELKRNLVRAAVASTEVLLNEMPGIQLISPEPVIHIIGNPDVPGDDVAAENYRLSQFQSWDMLCGRLAPDLGGRPEYLGIIGVNFYKHNQWEHNATVCLSRDDPRFRPFHQMLQEVWDRYRRPMFVSETGSEDDARADWFNYVCDEVSIALSLGVPIHGICLYPVLNHPGWDDDRHCCNGLFDYPDSRGNRDVHHPLAEALLYQQQRFGRELKTAIYDNAKHRSHLPISPSMGIRLSAPSTLDEQVCP
jgi:hypothetical protein